MDLTRRVRRWAFARPRVLLVGAPGTDGLRWAVEEELDCRGWTLAPSPSDTDLLVITGMPGPELSAAVEVLWAQIPQPRQRLDVTDEDQLHDRLSAVVRTLGQASAHPQNLPAQVLAPPADSSVVGMDNQTHRGIGTGGVADEHAAQRMAVAKGQAGHGNGHRANEGIGHAQHEGMGQRHEVGGPAGHAAMKHAGNEATGHAWREGHEEMGHAGPAGHEQMGHAGHEDMGHAGHGDMGHGGQTEHEAMGRAGDGGGAHEGHHMQHGGRVAGLDMAQTGPDRDGLRLDVLRVSLGPVLPGWPTGLVLEAQMQGDIVTDARFWWLDGGHRGDARPVVDPQRAALDRLASLLWVAGWSSAARDARWARDGLGAADVTERAGAARLAERVAQRVCRSRSLAWTVRGSGRLRHGHDTAGGGETLDRIRRWCAVAAGDVAKDIPVAGPEELARAVTGAELATVRLIVASVELDQTATGQAPERAHA